MKRFTIILPEELHTRFKIACALEGTDMSEVIRVFMAKYTERVKSRKLIPHPKEKK